MVCEVQSSFFCWVFRDWLTLNIFITRSLFRMRLKCLFVWPFECNPPSWHTRGFLYPGMYVWRNNISSAMSSVPACFLSAGSILNHWNTFSFWYILMPVTLSACRILVTLRVKYFGACCITCFSSLTLSLFHRFPDFRCSWKLPLK